MWLSSGPEGQGGVSACAMTRTGQVGRSAVLWVSVVLGMNSNRSVGSFVLFLLYWFQFLVRVNLATPLSAFYPIQDSILASEEQVCLSQPPRFINCCQEGESCSIVLNVTYMQTKTVYEYNFLVDVAVIVGSVVMTSTQWPSLKTVPCSFNLAHWHILWMSSYNYPILTDGQRKAVIAVNNQVPAPTIIGNRNEMLEVRVVNNLAMHGDPRHSLALTACSQHTIDGWWSIAQLTQCPITSYTKFTYKFILDQTGTHWYHAHNGGQRSSGLFGALIAMEFEGTGVDTSTFIELPKQHSTLTFIDWHN